MKKLFIVYVCLGVLAVSGRAGATENWKKDLPEWLDLGLELRHRYEWRSNFDFNDSIEDDKGFHLWRTRFNLTLKPSDEVKLFYQFQDARISHDSTIGSKAGFEDWAETRQLWIEAKSPRLAWDAIGLTSAGIKVGRQEFSYGAQRLLGAFNWSNVAQTYDAGKVLLGFDKLNIEIFGGGKTPNKSPRESNDFYSGDDNDRLAGYYAAYKEENGLLIEQYVINRNTNGKTISFGQTGDGEVDDYTIGGRIAGKWRDTPVDFELEAAKQVGDSGRLDVDAQMLAAVLGYTFDHAWKPRAAFEFAYASGDDDPADGKRRTFNNLHPTNHLFYGYMDLVGLQNIHNYRFQVSARPIAKLRLQADYHLLYLDTEKDQLYSAARTVKRATASGADRYVGSEIDLLVNYKVCDYADMILGYSRFFAGDFLKDTGSADDADYVYLQTTLSF